MKTLAYRVAQAVWLGEVQDTLFMSSVLQSARAFLGKRVRNLHRGGLSSRNARVVSEFIDGRIKPKLAICLR